MMAAGAVQAAQVMQARGLAAAGRPLRAADLKPGTVYLSPAGRKCMLLQPADSGLARSNYLFAYITRTGRASDDDGFALSVSNAGAIAALRVWRA